MIGILRDMRELDKARAYAESLIKNAPDPVFVSDLEGKILQANDAVFALLGFRPDELIEQSLSRIISPAETREFLAALREVVERGVTRNARLNPRSASGEVIPTTLNASALRDPDGKVIGAIGILRDMRELDKARAYAESLIKNAPDSVFVSDLEGKILQANDAVSALLGFRPDELIEQSLSRFISPEETREFTAALREVVERGVTRNARLNPRSASGEVIPTALNASALRDPNGKVIGAIGILRDMREYEQVVRDLEKSKNELRELRDVIRRAVVLASDVIEPEHMSLFASDASPAITLRGQPAPVGPSLKEIAEAAAADAERQAIRQALQATGGNRSTAARHLRTDYKTLYLKMKQYGIPAARFRKSRTSHR